MVHRSLCAVSAYLTLVSIVVPASGFAQQPGAPAPVGIPAKPVPVDVVHYSPGFMPYGTPCGEDMDPVRARIAELEREIDELRKEVRTMKARRQPQPKVKSA